MNKVMLLFLLIISGTIVSCTKTEELPAVSQNKILSFRVTNLPDTVIYAAVDNIDNTITVYIPFYYGLNIIDPEFTLSPGAKLMEEVLPVNLEDTTQKYTVKAADGTTNVYRLKIVQLNPASLNIDWSATVEGEPLTYPYSTLPAISGNLNSKNIALGKVVLYAVSTGKTVNLNLSDAYILLSGGTGTYSLLNALIPADIDTGYYKVKMTFLGNEKEIERQLHIVHRAPKPNPASKSVKQGENVTFTSFDGIFRNLTSVKVRIDENVYPLTIVSYNALEMILKIPDDFPVGVYDNAQYDFQFEGYPVITKGASLTVNAK